MKIKSEKLQGARKAKEKIQFASAPKFNFAFMDDSEQRSFFFHKIVFVCKQVEYIKCVWALYQFIRIMYISNL